VVVPVRIDNLIPHAALFALRNINALEELSYDYNQANQTDLLTANINNNNDNKLLSNKIKCFCNTKTCKGYLPNSK